MKSGQTLALLCFLMAAAAADASAEFLMPTYNKNVDLSAIGDGRTLRRVNDQSRIQTKNPFEAIKSAQPSKRLTQAQE